MNMRFQGTVKSWNDERGFGFIAPVKGDQDVFFHIKAFRSSNGRPQVGQSVSFEIELNADGKKRAKAVEELRTAVSRASGEAESLAQWGTATLLAILAFVIVFLAAAIAWRVPVWVAGLYAGASVVTFILYRADKAAARAGGWRIPEAWLLAAGLAGGWPGALVAQQLLRHKSVKRSFRAEFWATVVLNVAAFLLLASPLALRLSAG